MRRPLLAAALLLLAPSLFAQAYKWTDSAGTVHYSETPPPTGTKFQKITTVGTAEPVAQPAQNTESPAEATPKPAPAAQPMADTPANRAKFCASLKSNLDLLQGEGPVAVQQGDGQQQNLDDDQRKNQLATAQAQYQKYCGK
ncbi:MAG TPA: DUF4124 domain-containing protein [Dyella sp.]|uniref:DUF4124 domain-containing protein n=1 Tax=Dyella sp. TaxID=1869338 RepID=UPI002F95EF1B